jgi:hypothetical protein
MPAYSSGVKQTASVRTLAESRNKTLSKEKLLYEVAFLNFRPHNFDHRSDDTLA